MSHAQGAYHCLSGCIVAIVMVSAFFTCVVPTAADTPPYKDPKLPVEQRVKDLLSRMTLDEKLNQIRCDWTDAVWVPAIKTTGFGELATVLRPYKTRESAERANEIQKMAQSSRLGIPIIVQDEAVHGLHGSGPTAFPQPTGLAAMWNVDLMSQVATAIAKETKSRGVRQVLSPVINVVRDARWGRVEETYGEDPLLTSRMGVAFVKAFESNGVVSTPKHYVVNSWDGGRDSNGVEISERSLREIYMPPFKAAVQEGGARSVMAAYNSLDGKPCSSNHWLLTDVLRKEWGFEGFVVSDYSSVVGIEVEHFTTANHTETAAAAMNAGLDMEYPTVNIWGDPLKEAVEKKMVSMRTLDEAVSRVLRVKFEIGLFDDPMVDPAQAVAIVNCKAHRDLSAESARQSMVLLKNNQNTLPFSKDVKTIAVIGEYAGGPLPLGGYSASPEHVVGIIDGIQAKLPNAKILYAKGCGIWSGPELPAVPASALIPEGGNAGEQGLRGEYFANQNLEGAPALVRIDNQVDFQWGDAVPDPAIPAEHFSARWTGSIVAPESGDYQISVTSDDGFRLFIDGKNVVEYWADRAAAANVVNVYLQGGRPTPIKLEYYNNLGAHAVSLGWGKADGVDPGIAEAVNTAKQAQVAIVVAGIAEGEGADRAFLDLPGKQEQLIKAVAATGTPTVVLLIAGAPVTMEHWLDDVGAIVDAWYPGEEGGTAIADVLFGDYNPAGRLPITFPRSVGQCPVYYNQEPPGRGYQYVDSVRKPRFAFGYGLSYTQFTYANLKITPDKGKPNTTFTVAFDVANSGKVAGDEVPQLYVRDLVASIVRPLKSLKAFTRITLKPGEKQRITFTLTPDDLSFLDDNMKPIVEPGIFDVMVGASSDDIRLDGKIEVTK